MVALLCFAHGCNLFLELINCHFRIRQLLLSPFWKDFPLKYQLIDSDAFPFPNYLVLT